MSLQQLTLHTDRLTGQAVLLELICISGELIVGERLKYCQNHIAKGFEYLWFYSVSDMLLIIRERDSDSQFRDDTGFSSDFWDIQGSETPTIKHAQNLLT